VVIEDLNVSGMLKNRSLFKAIIDAGMGRLRRLLAYKTAWAGEQLLVADRFFPSSRLCQHCGQINKELKLSDREWVCSCGAVLDRDLNAAINLKNLATTAQPPASTKQEPGLEPNAQ
jgi:putative transposase